MTQHEEELIRAAIRWWLDHRPPAWEAKHHHLYPDVNCKTVMEKRLAFTVAKVVRMRAKRTREKHAEWRARRKDGE